MPVLIYNQAKTDIIKSIRKDRQREVAQFDPIGMPIILLKNAPSEFDKYVIDKELQHSDDFTFCATLFDFRFVFDKIS
jgi:hypothetical protein